MKDIVMKVFYAVRALPGVLWTIYLVKTNNQSFSLWVWMKRVFPQTKIAKTTVISSDIFLRDNEKRMEVLQMDQLTHNSMGEDVDSWKSVMFIYNSALKEVGTKLEILNDEFQHVHQYNPIEYIKSRIKSPESIVKKLKRHGYESSISNMIEIGRAHV